MKYDYSKSIKNNLIVYRFLYSNSYPFEVLEDQFWAYGFYHNDFAIHSSNSSFEAILKSIKNI